MCSALRGGYLYHGISETFPGLEYASCRFSRAWRRTTWTFSRTPPGLAESARELNMFLLELAGLPLGLAVRAAEVAVLTLNGTELPLEAAELPLDELGLPLFEVGPMLRLNRCDDGLSDDNSARATSSFIFRRGWLLAA